MTPVNAMCEIVCVKWGVKTCDDISGYIFILFLSF